MLVRINLKRIGEILLVSYCASVIGMLIVATTLFWASQIFSESLANQSSINGEYHTRCIKNAEDQSSLLTLVYGEHIPGTTKVFLKIKKGEWQFNIIGYADNWCLKPGWKMIVTNPVQSISNSFFKGIQADASMEVFDRVFLKSLNQKKAWGESDWRLHNKVRIIGKASNIIGTNTLVKNAKFEGTFKAEGKSLTVQGQSVIFHKK